MKFLCSNSLFKEASQVIQTLHKHGFTSYFAGGCVRDALLHIPVHDIDIATDAKPHEVQNIFNKTFAVGIAFGVIVVRLKHYSFEVTTFRSDGDYHDGRHPDSIQWNNAKEDAHRRDFTINGLFYDPIRDTVIDYVDGKKDLLKKRLRCIGDPKQRFQEDQLRLLRALRFSGTLGFTIETHSWNVICSMLPNLPNVSPERIGQELTKMFSKKGSSRCLQLLHQTQFDCHYFPEYPLNTHVFQTVEQWQNLYPHENDPFPIYFLWFHLTGMPLELLSVWKSTFRLSNHWFKTLSCYHHFFTQLPSFETMTLGQRRFLFKSPHRPTLQKLLQLLAPHYALSSTQLQSYLQESEHVRITQKPLINGYDLIQMGFSPSPHF